ncbi:MAG: amino acid permease [Zavarzinella sp.]
MAGKSTKLSLWDAICLIIGIIIGASIYQAPPEIFRSAGSPMAGMTAWILGGIVSLIGALCYAELATTYRTSGGDYTYLTKAYGPKVGFFFAWAELAVIRTGGSIAFMAYVFARYATEFYPLGQYSRLIYAISGILTLTLINAIGVRPGRLVQNILTSSNIIGLTSISLIGLIWYLLPDPQPNAHQELAVQATMLISSGNQPFTSASIAQLMPEPIVISLAFTMVMVFYAYGGWNEAAFIASEVHRPKRNIKKALLLGTLLVTTIYLAVNLAYLGALGYTGVCNSKAIAADMFELPFGNTGRKLISGLVMVSALGSVHGLLFTGMRLYGTFGKDHRLFAWLSGKGDHPHAQGALFAQAGFSLLLIAVVELASQWRGLLCQCAEMCGYQMTPGFHQSGDIYQLVACTAPVFWLFFFLTGTSLFVLRWRDPDARRTFKVPMYPILPAFFVLSCAFMLWKATAYAFEQEPAEAIVVIGLMMLGIPLGWISMRGEKKKLGTLVHNSK